jgi:hypothetical protein
MHLNLRNAGWRSKHTPTAWIYRWGFTVWIGPVEFSIGHDVRPQVYPRYFDPGQYRPPAEGPNPTPERPQAEGEETIP